MGDHRGTREVPASDVMSRFRLDGLTAVVTGSGRGIGKSCAIALADAGAQVIVTSRTATEILATAKEIAQRGGAARAIRCDVTDRQSVHSLFGELARVDILVNNAGANVPEPFLDVKDSTLEMLLAVNVKATFLCSQIAAEAMVHSGQGGAIVNVTSQLGHVGFAGRTVYTLTKHAIEGLTKAMALELAPNKIRVNAVAPTFVETPMTKRFLDQPRFREQVLSRIPIGRLGTVEEVASAVVFLASPAASLITGASLLVDGGWTAQ